MKIAELEETLASLHRREMRVRSVLSSALSSPQSRQEAYVELEELLKETEEAEEGLSKFEAVRDG